MEGRRRLTERAAGKHVQAVSQDKSEMLLSGLTSCDGERNYSSEVADVTLPRKASKEHVNCPYRKPTQVVEERILR